MRKVIIVCMTLLVFSEILEGYFRFEDHSRSPELIKRILFYSRTPFISDGKYDLIQARSSDSKKIYWYTEAKFNFQQALFRSTTYGYLWEILIKIRKNTGLNYKEYILQLADIDPLRIDEKFIIDNFNDEETAYNWEKLSKFSNFHFTLTMKLINKLKKTPLGIRKLKEWQPKSDFTKIYRAKALYETGNRENAMKVFRKYGNYWMLKNALGKLMTRSYYSIRKKEPDKWGQLLEDIYSINPLLNGLNIRLFLYYRSKGEKDKAGELVETYRKKYSKAIVTLRLNNFIKKHNIKIYE